MVYKAVNTADSMIGYLTPRHAAFGWASARFDDLLNWVPARVSAGLIAVVGGGVPQWRDITRDAALHRSPNAGWPEAAMARALSIALAGPRRYHGTTEDLSWVNGTARRDLGPADIDAAIAIVWKAWAMAVGLAVCIGAFSWVF
jgi:adenosylcobinamide-phosphate synthase